MMPLDMRDVTVSDILTQTTVEDAQEVHDQTWCKAPSNSEEPWEGLVPPVGTWRYDGMLDEWEVLVELPADQVEPSAQDWEFARRHWTTRNYVRWAREGKQAPPVDVMRHVSGRLVSANRRRVLAAWEAGLPAILAWFSETDDRGRALWRMKG